MSASPQPTDGQKRKQREIEHGRRIVDRAEAVWQRHTQAGRTRLERRFADLREYLQTEPEHRILELGCGTGVWTERLATLPGTLAAIDISPDLLSAAKRKLPLQAVAFAEGDVEHLPFADRSFDVVCGLSVLHHLDVNRALAECCRVLKPGGKIWFSEPNMLNPQIFIQKNVLWIKVRMGDTPDEKAFFRWPLKRALESAGFRNVRVDPFDFLHPQTPDRLSAAMERFGAALEKVPGLREIAGSLLVHAEK